MNEIINYSFLSWTQFLIIAVVAGVSLIVANRFHLFSRHSWTTSIGYHMFFCIVLSLVVIAFLLVRPLFHLILLLVLFGFMYKNIFAYVRSIFNLYFSNIRMGDRVKINNIEGNLTNINIGGMHVSSHNEKTYFPFNGWKGEKITLLSEDGKVPVSLDLSSEKFTDQHVSVQRLEKSLFQFPYLATEKIDINIKQGEISSRVQISSDQFRDSLLEKVTNDGFSINNTNNN